MAEKVSQFTHIQNSPLCDDFRARRDTQVTPSTYGNDLDLISGANSCQAGQAAAGSTLTSTEMPQSTADPAHDPPITAEVLQMAERYSISRPKKLIIEPECH
ncbi:hypothetical protein [Streptomyces diastatochromogenes]|uniref:hypothetical protein n=1 Tax=Streptomyces diastatochromogenes TaxID=42236 RepID=UPI0036C24357